MKLTDVYTQYATQITDAYTASAAGMSTEDIMNSLNSLAYKKLYFLEEGEIEIKDLESYLNLILSKKIVELKGNSELKRLIRIFDFIKYKSVHDKLFNSANTIIKYRLIILDFLLNVNIIRINNNKNRPCANRDGNTYPKICD